MADSFPQRPPSPKLALTGKDRHMHTLSLVDGSSDPGAGFYGDGNMASIDLEGAQSG